MIQRVRVLRLQLTCLTLKPLKEIEMQFFSLQIVTTLLLLAINLSGCGTSDTDEEYLKQAQIFYADGNPSAATIELKNALVQNPKNTEARKLLGEIYLADSAGVLAEKELLKAIEYGDNQTSTRLDLFQSYLLQSKFDEIIENLDLNTFYVPGEKSRAYALAGNAYLGTEQTVAAATLFEKSLETLDNADARTGEIKIAIESAEPEVTQRMIEDALALYPKNFELNFVAASYYHYQLSDYTRALDLISNTLPTSHLGKAQLLKAESHFALSEYELAEATLNEILAARPTYAPALFLMAKIKFASIDYETAQELLEQVLLVAPNHEASLLMLGSIYFEDKQFERAQNYLQKYWSVNKESEDVAKLLAAIYLQQDEYVEAESILLPFVANNPDDITLLEMVTSAVLRQGKIEGAEAYLQRIIELKPDSVEANYYLGVNLLAKGETDAGIDALKNAVANDKTRPETRAMLMKIYIERSEFGKAAALAKEINDEAPTQPIGWNYLGLVKRAEGQIPEAKAYFEKALKLAPNDPAANHQLAAIARSEGNYQLAQGYYDSIYLKYPNHFATRIANVSLYSEQQNFPAAIEQLSIAVSANPADIPAGLLLSSYYMRYGQLLDALSVLATLENIHGDHQTVLLAQAEAMLLIGFYDSALATSSRLIAVAPDSALAHAVKAAALISTREFGTAAATLSEAQTLDPENFRIQLEQIKLAIALKQYSNAQNIASQLETKLPENHEIISKKGEIAFAKKKFENASSLFGQALSLHADSKTIGLLGKALWQSGDQKAAIRTWVQWLTEFPKDRQTRLLLAKAYKLTKNNGAAIKEWEVVISYNKNDSMALNELAWSLHKSEINRAREYADRAYSLAPNNFNVVDTLAVISRLQGQPREAVYLLRKIVATTPANPSFQFHLAQALADTGANDEALQLLNKALSGQSNFPERDEATALSEKLLP